jgi:hypothetical protein
MEPGEEIRGRGFPSPPLATPCRKEDVWSDQNPRTRIVTLKYSARTHFALRQDGFEYRSGLLNTQSLHHHLALPFEMTLTQPPHLTRSHSLTSQKSSPTATAAAVFKMKVETGEEIMFYSRCWVGLAEHQPNSIQCSCR